MVHHVFQQLLNDRFFTKKLHCECSFLLWPFPEPIQRGTSPQPAPHNGPSQIGGEIFGPGEAKDDLEEVVHGCLEGVSCERDDLAVGQVATTSVNWWSQILSKSTVPNGQRKWYWESSLAESNGDTEDDFHTYQRTADKFGCSKEISSQLPYLTGNLYQFRWQQGYQAWNMFTCPRKSIMKKCRIHLNPWTVVLFGGHPPTQRNGISPTNSSLLCG